MGLYILHILRKEIKEVDFAIYRDDGIGVHKRLPKTKLNGVKNKMNNIFKQLGLKTEPLYNQTRIDFLDVTFDLHKETHRPYRKPNDRPTYVHAMSNHPPHVKKNIPIAVNKRLCELSSNEEIFNESKKDYSDALKKSGHSHKLTYKKPDTKTRKKRQRRKDIIWFTPPYSASLKTNIGQEFLKILDKNFPINKPLHQEFNRKTVKIGYSCMKNMSSIISNHNRKIINSDNKKTIIRCSCTKETVKNCPIPKKCFTKEVVYKATVKATNANYIGMAGTDFKARYKNHLQNFEKEHLKKSTTLSLHVWENNLNPDPEIKWELLRICSAYKPGNKACDLCISEKLEIITASKDPNNINKRTDLGTRCLHRRQHALGKIT